MADCRKVQVVLLDDRKLLFNVQPKMHTYDLFDIVASNFNLREKEYFGLYYLDDTGYQQWLQSDRKVLDHDLPRKSEPVLLYFAVRFYIEDMCYLQDSISVELYYLQARQSVYRGVIECDSTTVFELAAYALQISYENLIEDVEAREALKKLPVFPTSTLREHPSIQYCEDQVLKRYYAMNGVTRGQAVISYMCIVEKLPTYGIHYYEVKNKQAVPWWLGLSFKGIAQFDYKDKRTPRRVFPWKYLENLYFRDKKFSIEVHDPKRIVHTLSSFNLYEDAIREPMDECDDLSDAISDPTTQVSVSRRTFGPSNVNVYAWFTTKPQLTKCIWSMAVCQHQFFLDRLQNKASLMVKRCPNQVASELSMSTTNLQSVHSIVPGTSPAFLKDGLIHSYKMDPTKKLKRSNALVDEATPEQKALQLELYKGLGERKKNLEQVLKDKIKDLKQLCLQESDITGELPHEYTLFMAPGEKTPTIKKRMGTKFSIADLVSGKDSDVLSKLEMEFEVQKQITKAKQKLSMDESLPKNVRKKHKDDYTKNHAKLKDLEQRLKSVRSQAGLDTGSLNSEDFVASAGSLAEFLSEDSISTGSSPALAKSPRKSASSQQLEALDHSPLARRRLNSASKLYNSQKSNGSRVVDIPSNPSSSSSLASLSQFEGCNEFTPTKVLKYNRTAMPGVSKLARQQVTDLDSAGSSTANSSTSSLHAYSVSNGRPLRSGSMDDVRLAGSANGNSSLTNTLQSQSSDRSLPHSNSTSSNRSRSYLSNNPYGSLERKALKQRRSMNRSGDSTNLPNPNAYSPFNNHADYVNDIALSQRPPVYKAPPEYRKVPSQPELQATVGRMQPPPPPPNFWQKSQQQINNYAQNVQKTSLKMYDNSQPFQMLENPYYSHRKNIDKLAQTLTETHIAPIKLETEPRLVPRRTAPPASDYCPTDSSSNHSSPKENAFNFFNSLSSYVQTEGRVPNGNTPYVRGSGGGGGGGSAEPAKPTKPPRAYVSEESKPFEMKDFYQYSERLRRARGIATPVEQAPPLPQSAIRPPSRSQTSPGQSLNGSRSASPFTYVNQPVVPSANGSSNISRYSPSLSHQSSQYSSGVQYNSGVDLRPAPPRRSNGPSKDSSFTTGDVADNFSQEMLAWYQDQDPEQTSSTLV